MERNSIKVNRHKMDYRLEQELKPSIQLKLTPSVYLYLEVLQLPLPRLEEVIRNEIEENPLLDIEEEEGEREERQALPDFVFEGGNVFPAEYEEREASLPAKTSLRELLLSQAKAELKEDAVKVAEMIIDNLDSRGFLTLSEKEIAERLSVPESLVRSVRETVKTLDPPGCASYTVVEAFKAQMRELNVPDKLVKALDYLELLPEQAQTFKERANLDEEEFREFLKVLRRLDPQPGNLGDFNTKVVPDIKVSLENERVVVSVTQPQWFKLRVNSYYLKYADQKELRRYINEKYQRAINLRKAVEQRNETLKRIGEAVFKHQKQFLIDGKTLKPLSYRDVAEELSLHESTVSRAVKDKFAETPYGTFPLKFFFRKGIGETPSDRVRERIKQIIRNENKEKPLSDGKIAEILKREGINIARRTVAKYREEMGIPGAYERRRRH